MRVAAVALALALAATACGSGGDDPAGVDAGATTIAQASASGRENVPSALDDRTNSAFPAPLSGAASGRGFSSLRAGRMRVAPWSARNRSNSAPA